MTDTLNRPSTIEEVIGQREVIARLKIAVGGSLSRGVQPPHVLLSGPPGHGKTTLARVVADVTGGDLHDLHGQTLSKKGDLASILMAVEPGSVVFIDEVHALPTSVSECLYEALEDGKLSIVVGAGASASAITLDLPAMTIVGATTKPGALSTPLRDRFGLHLTMQPYTEAELAAIIGRSWDHAQTDYASGAAELVAARAKGVPRLALALAAWTLNCLALAPEGASLTRAFARAAMEAGGIGEGGLDEIDRRILHALVVTFGGAAVGIENLAAALDLDATTLSVEHEPALTRAGLLVRTPQGRMATPEAHALVRAAA